MDVRPSHATKFVLPAAFAGIAQVSTGADDDWFQRISQSNGSPKQPLTSIFRAARIG
jgi:hypothetical protein